MSPDFQLNTLTINLFVHYPYSIGRMQGQLNLHGLGLTQGWTGTYKKEKNLKIES